MFNDQKQKSERLDVSQCSPVRLMLQVSFFVYITRTFNLQFSLQTINEFQLDKVYFYTQYHVHCVKQHACNYTHLRVFACKVHGHCMDAVCNVHVVHALYACVMLQSL